MNDKLPKHVAIVMDGNGRWAQQRLLPRVAGHKAGVTSVREIIKATIEHDIPYLTLFAFGQENWRRPAEEVGFLMSLLLKTLKLETKRLHENGVKLLIIGERKQLSNELQAAIHTAEQLTINNSRLQLTIAINYSGQWDILQATQRWCEEVQQQSSAVPILTAEMFAQYLSTSTLPDPDLFIRTSGEHRISNFMLWQMAYTEFYFTEKCWPDFRKNDFAAAIDAFQNRERRYGFTSAQLLPAT
jgi:undecaprenyl diphosphate synthase